jgi:hypothetical protein
MIRFGAKARLFEEFLYTQVHAEVQAGAIRPGLWAKAEAEAMGDESKTKAIYLRLRVESLRDEASILEEFERRRLGPRGRSQGTSQMRPPPVQPRYHPDTQAPPNRQAGDHEGADVKSALGEVLSLVAVLAIALFFLFFVATQ